MSPESETIISDTTKPTESVLVFEQFTTASSGPIDNSKPSNIAHPRTLRLDPNEEKEILYTLQNLHECFVSLIIKVKEVLKEKVHRGDLNIGTLTEFIQTYMHWENLEELKVIEDLDELFTKLHRYFDFLQCGLIVAITKEYIQGELATQLKQHRENALNLRRQQSIKNLKNELRNFYTPHLQDTSNMPEIYIQLNEVWEEADIEGLYLLVKCLLPKTKQQSLLEHITIDDGSVLIKYRVEKSYVDYLIAYAENKPQFMRLIGIFGLVINNIPILQEDENKNFTFDSALLESSQSGNNEAVQFLLDLGVNVNYSNSEGKTALMLACQAGHEEVVQALVSAEADVNLQDSAGQTALMLADGNVGIVHRLLLAKADPNLQRKDGNTALHIACYKGQSTIPEALLSFGATFVIPNTKGDTAFLASVRGNNTEILKLMLNSIPHSPFIVSLGVVYACRFGHSAVFNLFAKQLEYTARIANFFISCAEGDVGSVVQHIMEFNIDPNTTLISGITPLMIASSFGNADVLDCLLEAKADVNSTDQDGYSPLTYAITGNTSLHIVQCLLEAGSNPNILVGGVATLERAREKGEQTICGLLLKYLALHLYKRFIHLVDRIQEGIDTLIKGGKDILLQITQQLETNFHLTGLASKVQTSIDLFNQLTPYYDFLHFEMLVMTGREFLKGDIENEVEEYHVMATNFEESVEIQHFKDVLSLVPQQEVMISTSCSELTFKLNRQWGNITLKSLRRLYSYLFSENQKYLSHMTIHIVEEVPYITFLIPKLAQVVGCLISEVIQKRKLMYHLCVIEIMLGNVLVLTLDEIKNFTFDSALLESSQSGNNEAVQFLLDLGVNVNYSNSEGKTALMLASEAGHEEVVQILVSAGANVNLQDSAGQTALMFADGNVGVACRLLLANADPNLQQKDGNTALHIACYKHQSVIAEALLSFSATFVIPNTKGDTAFLASVRGNNTEILKLMLNSIPHSPFIVFLGVVYACRFGHSAVFNIFVKQLEYTARIANFFISCAEGDVGSVVQHIMEFNIDPNTTLISGITPLMIASSFGNADVLDCLLEAKADVNSTDQDGYSPLTYAITGNTSLHIVQCLLEAEANPNILVGGVTIVERAREKGEQTICDFLLKYLALHLYKRFIHLVDRIQEGIDTLINQRGIDIIFQITRKLEVNFYLTGLTSEVLTSIALLNQLTPYYDFLHFEMLVIIVREFLKGDIENELEEYEVMATKFEELVEIQKFKDVLSLVPQQEVTTCSELTFQLKKQWGNLTLKSLRRLYSYLFSDCQMYPSHMTVDVTTEVPHIKFLIPKSTQIIEDLTSEEAKKKNFMCLLGVIIMMIDSVPVLTANEHKNFTFDSALLESSQSGNNEAVQFILDLGVNINYSNSEGKTALMLACQAGHEEVVQTLVSAEADVNLQDSAGETALMLADGNIGIIHCLLLAKSDPNLQRKDGNTALHIACYKHQSTTAELLLSFGATFVIPNTKGDTAFLASVRGNNTEILKLMLNSIPHSPFIVSLGIVYACRFGHSAIFNLFVKQLEYTAQIANCFIPCAEGDVGSVIQHIMEFNIDPNTTLISGITPLMIASSFGNPDMLDCLLEAAADVNSIDQDGYSPLTYAVTGNTSLHIVQRLLEAGANPNILVGGVTIVERAREKGEQTICDLLLKYLALHLYKRFIHLVDRIQEGIDTLIKEGKYTLFQIIQQLGANFHVTGLTSKVLTSIDLFNQLTPYYDFLHFQMLVMIVREFLKGDIENELEVYCVMASKFEETVEIQKFKDVLSLVPRQEVTTCSELTFQLKKQWGNLTLKSFRRLYSYLFSDYQMYPSHMTIDVVEEVLCIKFLIPKSTQIVEELIVDFVVVMKKKSTFMLGVIIITIDNVQVLADENTSFTFDSALLELSQSGNNEAVQFLLDLGVNINYSNSEGKTAVMLASEAGHEEVVKTLVSAEANINLQDNKGFTALMVSKTKEIFSLLLQSNADITILTHRGSTPLIIASQLGHLSVVETLLVEYNNDPNFRTEIGMTALLFASLGGHYQVVEILLQKGADPNIHNNEVTALLLASQNGHYQVVEILLKNGADPNIHSIGGSTTLILSSQNGHQQIVELLLEKQVDPNVQSSKNGTTALIQASKNGHYQVIEILLKNGADPNIHNNKEVTALLFASQNSHYQVVEILLQNGADPNIHDNDGRTALILSSQNGHQQIVELLLEKQVDPNVQNSKNGTTALIQASQQGHYQVVEILLKKGADPNIRDNDGSTALLFASGNGHYQVAEILLKKGADPNIHDNVALILSSQQQIVELLLEKQVDPNVQTSKNGRTALIQASQQGHYQVVEILLKNGADPNIRDNDESTALLFASGNGHYQVAEILLKNGADPNIHDNDGSTALLFASGNGHYQVAEILLKNGADPNIHDNNGWTALILSSQNGHQQIVELLLEKQVDPNVQSSKNGTTALIQASKNGHYQVVEILLKNGADPNIHNNKEVTALLFASQNSHYQVVEILLQNGADPNIHDNDGRTALILSSQNGHQQIVELLLEKQVDPNVQNSKNGTTALIQASQQGHYQVVEILLKKGADPNIRDNDGSTALLFASGNGHYQVAEILLKKGADPNIHDNVALILSSQQQIVELLLEKQVDPNVQTSKNGRTALIQASQQGHYQVVEILLKNGADPNIRDNDESTALLFASGNGHYQVAEILLKNGADPNIHDNDGSTALLFASGNGHYQVAEILLKNGADPNIHDNNGWTALIVSSQNGHQQIVELLLEKQVDPNVQTSKNGRTALIQASRQGHYQVVEILLKNGADPNIREYDGSTALLFASGNGHYQVAEILLKNGADPNIHDNDGWTALIVSSQNGHQQIVELLLEKQVDPNVQNSKNGTTALIQASQQGHYQVVEILLKNGADPNIHENNGWTALIVSSQNGHYQVVEILLKNGANPNIHSIDGWTALILSSQNGHQQVVELLLEKQVDPNVKNSKNGTTALIQTSKNGHYQVVEILLKNGADPNIHNNEEVTALLFAIHQGHHQVVEVLLKIGADPEIGGRIDSISVAAISGNIRCLKIIEKHTILSLKSLSMGWYYACCRSHVPIITFLSNRLDIVSDQRNLIISCAEGDLGSVVDQLMSGKISPDVQFVHGVAPLMISSSCGHTDIVEALITAGANVNKTDEFGQTALDYTEQAKQDKTRHLLLQHGGLHGTELVITSKTPEEPSGESNFSTEEDISNLQSPDTTIFTRRKRKLNISSIMKYLEDSIDTHFTKHHSGYTKDPLTRYTSNIK